LNNIWPLCDQVAESDILLLEIKDNRCLIVGEVLKNKIPLAHIVENKECGFDIEDGGPNNLPRTRCPTWRSTHLTTILHCLDKIAQSKAVHHRTITSNHQLYGHSQKLFRTFIGIKGVPRDLPRDCFNEVWWNELSPSNKQVLSQVVPINLAEVAKNLELHCHVKTVMAGGDAGTGGSGKSMPKRRIDEAEEEVGPPVPSGSGPHTTVGENMHVD
jgi:hypothetical protein